jgi:hypothetical protein
MSDFTDTMGASAFGVDNTLGDSLSCEVSELVNEVEVLKKNGTVGTGGE